MAPLGCLWQRTTPRSVLRTRLRSRVAFTGRVRNKLFGATFVPQNCISGNKIAGLAVKLAELAVHPASPWLISEAKRMATENRKNNHKSPRILIVDDDAG